MLKIIDRNLVSRERASVSVANNDTARCTDSYARSLKGKMYGITPLLRRYPST